VRSLARGSPSSPRYEPYRDDSDDDIRVQSTETESNSGSSVLPAPARETDLEQGIASPTPRARRSNLVGSWRSLLAGSLRSNSRTPQEDRDR
jgi:hypothetical protein